MTREEVEAILNDPELYPLGIIYLIGPNSPVVVVKSLEEVLPDIPFLLAIVYAEGELDGRAASSQD